MLGYLASFAASVAAAVTGTPTAETDAAGVRFGPGTAYPAELATGRRPLRFSIRVVGHGGGEWRADCVAPEWRAAVRLTNRHARTAPVRVGGFDGPAVRFGRFSADGGRMIGRAYNADGVEIGTVSIGRADGSPIRAGKGARRGEA
jgi:hypothetical protein